MAHLCGCWYILTSAVNSYPTKHYLPLVDLSVHTTVLSTTSRTQLTQTFVNPSSEQPIKECVYVFPLYDGVSVVRFTCRIGSRVIKGVVKEREKARKIYSEAVERGETAGLLQQLDNSDVFSTKIGNIPAGQKVIVDILYVGELKHDAETDGIRFTIPTMIAPRYGTLPQDVSHQNGVPAQDSRGIRITVDAHLAEGSFIRGIQSPTHPIAVTMGSTSTKMSEQPQMHTASATLTLGKAELDKDFVLIILAKETASPKALLETHSSIPHQRALMVTLVPQFALPPSHPEIIFVVDRSGSMSDKTPTLISALEVFLKSLPVGVRFNICSFGSSHCFLWPKSKAYAESTLAEAMQHVRTFGADLGGTETFAAIKATIESRYKDLPLEVMLLTDGEIWNQKQLFSYLNKEVGNTEAPIRVFSLGIGNAVSHALIEGVARAGNGFSQSVGENEKLDSKVVRMLKGGLSPHVADYTLEVKYDIDDDDEDGFEMIERVTDGLSVLLHEQPAGKDVASDKQRPISLFDITADPDKEDTPMHDDDGQDRYNHLPAIPLPNLLQAPHRIPPLFPFNRTTVYLLMGPQAYQKTPKSVVLKATSPHGPLELEIPVQVISEPGETIHQLAAKKAVGDFEEGRGWLFDAKDETGMLVRERFESRFGEMVEREAVRLGVEFQVGGKWCSFVAVEDGKERESTAINIEEPLLQEEAEEEEECEEEEESVVDYCAGSTSSTYDPTIESSSPPSNYVNPQTRDQPLFNAFAQTKGSSSLFALESERVPDPAKAARCSRPPPPLGSFAIKRQKKAHSLGFAAKPSSPPLAKSSVDIDALVDSDPNADPLHALITLQLFDGSWPFTDNVLRILHLTKSDVETTVPTGRRWDIWATLLAVCWLEKKMTDRREAWELVAEKARGWVEDFFEAQGVEVVVRERSWGVAEGLVVRGGGKGESGVGIGA